MSEELWTELWVAACGHCNADGFSRLESWPKVHEALMAVNIDLPPETEESTFRRVCLAVICLFSSQDALDRIADLAKILVSGKDLHGTPIKSRARFTTLLREIISETNVPKASGHRWDFR